MIKIESPLKEAIEVILGKKIPFDIEGIKYGSEMTEKQWDELQDFCSYHARPSWATGISIVEAAEEMVMSAFENGNID